MTLNIIIVVLAPVKEEDKSRHAGAITRSN